jgi:hypothetical protein
MSFIEQRRDFLKKFGMGAAALGSIFIADKVEAVSSVDTAKKKDDIINAVKEKKISGFDRWAEDIFMTVNYKNGLRYSANFTILSCATDIFCDVHINGETQKFRLYKDDIPNQYVQQFVHKIKTKDGRMIFCSMMQNGQLRSTKDIPKFLANESIKTPKTEFRKQNWPNADFAKIDLDK